SILKCPQCQIEIRRNQIMAD
ncbi:unnamed protein product, partial [Rotaria sordida]